MNRCLTVASAVVASLLFAACGDSKEPSGGGGSAPATALPESLWLAAAPAGAKNVLEAAGVKDGEEVVLVGKVGGAEKVFNEQRAIFSLVDLSLKDCYDMADTCKTPWDYCCVEPQDLAKGTAAVEFHDQGALRKTTARGFHGLDHGRKAYVRGTARRDSGGNLVVRATGVHVDPTEPGK